MLTLFLLIFIMTISSIHELGHYIILRAFDIKDRSISIGMGRRIFTKGNLSVGWFPLVSFCKYDEQDLKSRKLYVRLILYMAGVFANLLSIIVAMSVVVCFFGFASTEVETTPLENLEKGDYIVEVNCNPVFTVSDVYEELSFNISKNRSTTDILLLRNGEYNLIGVQSDVNSISETVFKTRGVEHLREIYVPILFVKEYFHIAIEGVLNFLSKDKNYDVVVVSETPSESSGNKFTEKLFPTKILRTAPDLSAKSILIIFVMLSVWVILCNLMPLPILDGGKALMDIIITSLHLTVNEDKVNAMSSLVFIVIFVAYLLI